MTQNILIIPHYNNPKGLEKSIASIGASELLDVIIIDDGSVSEKINESLILQNKKFKGDIIFKYCSVNRGVEYVLNEGIDYALEKNYKYISRLDCGDLCDENRFKIQEDFLNKNTHIGIVGSQVNALDEKGNFLYEITLPTEERKVRNGMLIGAMFIHPTIMFRANIVEKVGKYPTHYKAAEDFAFFTNILKYYDGANIDKVLVSIELNSKGISLKNRKTQALSRINILKDNYQFGIRSTYGIFRSYILYYTPYSLIHLLKKILYK